MTHLENIVREKGIWKQTLAREVGVHPSTLGRMLKGKSKMSVWQKSALARALHVRIDTLFPEEPNVAGIANAINHDTTIQTKVCKGCLERKPVTAFHKHPQTKDGRENKCAKCRNDEQSKRRARQKQENDMTRASQSDSLAASPHKPPPPHGSAVKPTIYQHGQPADREKYHDFIVESSAVANYGNGQYQIIFNLRQI